MTVATYNYRLLVCETSTSPLCSLSYYVVDTCSAFLPYRSGHIFSKNIT